LTNAVKLSHNVYNMVAKNKSTKPKIRVEEIEEPEVEEEVTEEPEEKVEVKAPEKSVLDETSKSLEEENPPADADVKRSILEPPKVSTFSQLDTPPPPSGEEKAVTEPEKIWEEENKESDKETPSKGKPETSSEEVKEWLKEVRPDTTKEVEKGNGPNAKVVVLIVVILLILGAIVGGFFYYRQSVSEPIQEPVPTPSVPTVSPTALPIKVDLKTLSVNVLNGSGITGEAGRVKALLTKEEGFAADKVTTGNDTSSDHKETSVQLKKDTSETVFESIKEMLGETYDVIKSEEALEEDSKYDVVITVGAKKSS